MCDRTAERRFPLRSFNVGVNPLAVAGAGSEHIDAPLIQRDPIGNTELLPDPIAQTSKG
jgi:hypothetical protein